MVRIILDPYEGGIVSIIVICDNKGEREVAIRTACNYVADRTTVRERIGPGVDFRLPIEKVKDYLKDLDENLSDFYIMRGSVLEKLENEVENLKLSNINLELL